MKWRLLGATWGILVVGGGMLLLGFNALSGQAAGLAHSQLQPPRPTITSIPRPTLTPEATLEPPRDEDDETKPPAGAHIELQVQGAFGEEWTVVQWQDYNAGWHDVEGWRGTLDEGGRKRWWVAPEDFGTGPFRWVIYQRQGDEPRAESESFYLPHLPDETIVIEVLLEP
ncbi:MAG TPA: hypothetical protein DEP84_25125 [Chloroflexi bacterium]|nr:hypothetical protein [Chloroflexota bacterium]